VSLWRRGERRGTPFEFVVIGLGNPGKQYARSRHNVGQETGEELARRCGERLKGGRDHALVAESKLVGRRVVLAVPITFMNLSGQAAGALVRRYKIDDPGHVIVVHDELDLAPGTVRVKVGGGLAGHNGLKSISQHLKTTDFLRVRIGVGKPPSKEQGADHVLSRLPSGERQLLDEAIQTAADAVELLVAEGPDAAMRTLHRR
jgi:PTH1 family peptidyl-tRNA hydrolase